MERKFLDLKLDSNPLCCFHRGGAVVIVTKKSIVEAQVVKGKNIVGYCGTPLAKAESGAVTVGVERVLVTY